MENFMNGKQEQFFKEFGTEMDKIIFLDDMESAYCEEKFKNYRKDKLEEVLTIDQIANLQNYWGKGVKTIARVNDYGKDVYEIILVNGHVYVGEMDEKFRLNGRGILKTPNLNEKYVGIWENGKFLYGRDRDIIGDYFINEGNFEDNGYGARFLYEGIDYGMQTDKKNNLEWIYMFNNCLDGKNNYKYRKHSHESEKKDMEKISRYIYALRLSLNKQLYNNWYEKFFKEKYNKYFNHKQFKDGLHTRERDFKNILKKISLCYIIKNLYEKDFFKDLPKQYQMEKLNDDFKKNIIEDIIEKQFGKEEKFKKNTGTI